MSPLAVDAALYGLSALFAALTVLGSRSSDYRAWGKEAVVPYALVGLVSAFVAWRAHVAPIAPVLIRWVRRLGVGVLLLGAVVVPLVVQVTLRAQARPGAHAQPEVAVIERAGDRVAQNKDPYLAQPTTVGTAPSSDAKTVDSSAFFPYLPGMIPFGLVNTIAAPPELTDARVAFASFTLVVAAAALALSGASAGRRGRAFQFLVVLPSGALPMVTGGDDLPVLALMLLGLVLAARRRPVLGGIALGLGATLKLTAWPLALMLALVVADRNERRASLRYALAALVVSLPVLALGIAPGPKAFVENVIRFPLGLAHVRSPAASPLLGQVLVHAFPRERRPITVVLALAGAALLLAIYRRYRPRTPAAIARFVAAGLVIATVLAPATRFGYLIYPVNLLVWAYVLDEVERRRARRDEGQLAESTTNSRMSSELVGLAASPASAGLSAGVRGSTVTPTSQ